MILLDQSRSQAAVADAAEKADRERDDHEQAELLRSHQAGHEHQADEGDASHGRAARQGDGPSLGGAHPDLGACDRGDTGRHAGPRRLAPAPAPGAGEREDGDDAIRLQQSGDHGAPALNGVVLADVAVGRCRLGVPELATVEQAEHACDELGVIVGDDGREARGEAAERRRRHHLRDARRRRFEHLDLNPRGVVEGNHRHAGARADLGDVREVLQQVPPVRARDVADVLGRRGSRQQEREARLARFQCRPQPGEPADRGDVGGIGEGPEEEQVVVGRAGPRLETAADRDRHPGGAERRGIPVPGRDPPSRAATRLPLESSVAPAQQPESHPARPPSDQPAPVRIRSAQPVDEVEHLGGGDPLETRVEGAGGHEDHHVGRGGAEVLCRASGVPCDGLQDTPAARQPEQVVRAERPEPAPVLHHEGDLGDGRPGVDEGRAPAFHAATLPEAAAAPEMDDRDPEGAGAGDRRHRAAPALPANHHERGPRAALAARHRMPVCSEQ